MNRHKMLPRITALALLLLLLAGCGGATDTPVAQAPAATATTAPQQPAAADTPLPPEPAAIPVPPTPTSPPPAATDTPLPPEPTATSVPPTPTSEPPTPTTEPPAPTSAPALAISTTAFQPGGAIPAVHTCFGANASPPLAWSGVPAAAQRLLLLVYDLDAGPNLGASTPLGFAHWIV